MRSMFNVASLMILLVSSSCEALTACDALERALKRMVNALMVLQVGHVIEGF